MRQKGKIRSWDDDRGFGFIVPNKGEKDVFLHISALSNRDHRPEVGQIVTYALATDDRGRHRASKATLPGDRLPVTRKKRGAFGAVIVAAFFLLFLMASVLSGKTPALTLWIYLGLSLLTYLVYASDKRAARNGVRRTSESTLHWLALAGGWPGALIAQQGLRHKSKKRSFLAVFWTTVLLNVSIFVWISTPMGADLVQSLVGQSQALIGPAARATIEWAEPREGK
ncbi:MAG: cold shock and DUF1294 domain-containing protein [Haliea sp.]|uniref:cold shock and DUF1294 domain-containing protein n=1 Tax=Haliea sp. TaxID=1932666 RepID=UPI0032EBFF9D